MKPIKSGITMWFKLMERILFHGLLQVIIPGAHLILRLLTVLSLVIGILFEYRRHRQEVDEKRQLQELNRLLSLIESGNSPRYSYEQVSFSDYPDYLTHPLDTYFNPVIFKRQVGLFEKSILIKAELEAEFAVIGYRMTIMKFLPLLLMIGLQQVINTPPAEVISFMIVIGFLSSYYLSESLSRS